MEPKVKYCTVRDAINENGLDELHIECRFEDGQKFPAVVVDGEFEDLAFAIKDFLNSEQHQQGYEAQLELAIETAYTFVPRTNYQNGLEAGLRWALKRYKDNYE